MGTWSGRRALVTGASRGIGRAIAVALATDGAHVALVGRDWAALEETAARCREAAPEAARRAGGSAVATVAGPLVVVADVTDPDAADVLREAAGDVLHLLVNVAGAPGSASLLTDLDDADWQAAFELHVLAPARILRACHEALASAGGAVVNIGSIAANAAVARSAAYSAAKAGLASLTRATAIEWARDGVRANLVEPGYVATEFNTPLIEGGFEPALLAKVPTRRAVAPESVAQAVLFAGGNPDMTGAVLRVDGGQTAKL